MERYRIAPLGSRNTVGMSSKNNASVCFAPSASASSRGASATLIGLDFVVHALQPWGCFNPSTPLKISRTVLAKERLEVRNVYADIVAIVAC